jgi:hypothetical protein
MEHLEAFNTRLTAQSDLPEVGSMVTVEGWRRRGWVHRLALSLRGDWPQVTFEWLPFVAHLAMCCTTGTIIRDCPKYWNPPLNLALA